MTVTWESTDVLAHLVTSAATGAPEDQQPAVSAADLITLGVLTITN